MNTNSSVNCLTFTSDKGSDITFTKSSVPQPHKEHIHLPSICNETNGLNTNKNSGLDEEMSINMELKTLNPLVTDATYTNVDAQHIQEEHTSKYENNIKLSGEFHSSPQFCGFKTGKGRKINISETALAAVKERFECQQTKSPLIVKPM